MAAPTRAELRKLLGKPFAYEDAQADLVLSIITAMVKAYTRGRGFEDITVVTLEGEPPEEVSTVIPDVPNDDMRVAILTASARLLSHPRQLGLSETYGPQSAFYREGFAGFAPRLRVVRT